MSTAAPSESRSGFHPFRSFVRAVRELGYALVPDPIKDRFILPWRYQSRLGKPLSLSHPKTFTEKLQWIKLYDRKPLYTELVDKYSVRKHVERLIGKQYLVDLFGVYSGTHEIDVDTLPDAFVLKAVHGSGWNIICPDKSRLNWPEAKAKLDTWMRTNYYRHSREWVYRNVVPRIIGQKFLRTADGRDLRDYKFFCFNGEPRMIEVDVDLSREHTRNMYDLDWKKLPFDFFWPPCLEEIPRPEALDEMLTLARKLSSLSLFMRVDFFWHEGRVYFGEMTFYPESGFGTFDPPEYDRIYGDMLRLPCDS